MKQSLIILCLLQLPSIYAASSSCPTTLERSETFIAGSENETKVRLAQLSSFIDQIQEGEEDVNTLITLASENYLYHDAHVRNKALWLWIWLGNNSSVQPRNPLLVEQAAVQNWQDPDGDIRTKSLVLFIQLVSKECKTVYPQAIQAALMGCNDTVITVRAQALLLLVTLVHKGIVTSPVNEAQENSTHQDTDVCANALLLLAELVKNGEQAVYKSARTAACKNYTHENSVIREYALSLFAKLIDKNALSENEYTIAQKAVEACIQNTDEQIQSRAKTLRNKLIEKGISFNTAILKTDTTILGSLGTITELSEECGIIDTIITLEGTAPSKKS